MMNKLLSDESGFTMLEILLTLVLSGLIIFSVLPVPANMFMNYKSYSDVYDNTHNAYLLDDKIKQNIFNSRGNVEITPVGFNIGTSQYVYADNTLTIKDGNETILKKLKNLTYDVVGETLVITYGDRQKVEIIYNLKQDVFVSPGV